MSLFSMDGVVDFLKELKVDHVTIASILESLQKAAEDLPDDSTVRVVPNQAFGVLPAGREMGVHTDKAHEFLVAALAEMLNTMKLYDEGVRAFQQGANVADEYSNAEMRQIRKVTEEATRVNHRQRDGHYGGDH